MYICTLSMYVDISDSKVFGFKENGLLHIMYRSCNFETTKPTKPLSHYFFIILSKVSYIKKLPTDAFNSLNI